MPKIRCPKCQTAFVAAEIADGQRVSCLSCGMRLKVRVPANKPQPNNALSESITAMPTSSIIRAVNFAPDGPDDKKPQDAANNEFHFDQSSSPSVSILRRSDAKPKHAYRKIALITACLVPLLLLMPLLAYMVLGTNLPGLGSSDPHLAQSEPKPIRTLPTPQSRRTSPKNPPSPRRTEPKPKPGEPVLPGREPVPPSSKSDVPPDTETKEPTAPVAVAPPEPEKQPKPAPKPPAKQPEQPAKPKKANDEKLPDKHKILGEPIPGYKHVKIEGFDLLIHKEVLDHNDDKKFKKPPMDILEKELIIVSRCLPIRTVDVLRKVPIWVEWDEIDDPDYKNGTVAKYYGVVGGIQIWQLRDRNMRKANCVEIITLKRITEMHQQRKDKATCIIMHELAHAVHTHVFGDFNPRIKDAYDQAMDRKLYKGRYAAANEFEYFAELSCAYLHQLNYEPKNRAALEKHDPKGYELMELTWGKSKALDKKLKSEAERAAKKRLEKAISLWDSNEAKKRIEAIRQLDIVTDYYSDTEAYEVAVKRKAKYKDAKK